MLFYCVNVKKACEMKLYNNFKTIALKHVKMKVNYGKHAQAI